MTRSLARGSQRLSSGLKLSSGLTVSESEYGDVVDTAGSGPGATSRQAASRRCGTHLSIRSTSMLQAPTSGSQTFLLYGTPPADHEGCLLLCFCL